MLEKLAKELGHGSGSNVPGMEHCFRCKDGIDFNVPRPQARHSWPLCQLRMADTRSRQARMATMHLTPAHGCSLTGWIWKRWWRHKSLEMFSFLKSFLSLFQVKHVWNWPETFSKSVWDLWIWPLTLCHAVAPSNIVFFSCSRSGNVDAIKVLLAHGADPSITLQVGSSIHLHTTFLCLQMVSAFCSSSCFAGRRGCSILGRSWDAGGLLACGRFW